MGRWWLGALLVGCAPPPAPVVVELPNADGATTEVPQVEVRWDPSVGDPAVTAELGGPGFTGAGWTTATTQHQLGVPSAPRGGSFTLPMPDWPVTLRQAGPNWGTTFGLVAGPLLYHSLLEIDPVTGDFAPGLATHWSVSDDQRTYRFRIDPAARWSDGREITAQDVVDTFRLRTDPSLGDRDAVETLGRMYPPTAASKYVVEVRAMDPSWQNLVYLGAMRILPSAEIGALKGTDYLERYEFAFGAVSGPYQVAPADVKTGASITLTRREDWWGEARAGWDGWYNFDKVTFLVVADPSLRFERLKKGELDFMTVPKSSWWAEDIPSLPAVKHGLMVPRKFHTSGPTGFSGIAINNRRAPLDDLRVRQALQLLFDRQGMITDLFHGEYVPVNSYFPAPYADPNVPAPTYDEAAAVALLEAAGWTDTNADGFRVREGKELALTLNYASPLVEPALLRFRDAAARAGVKIEPIALEESAAWRALQEKDFQLAYQTWGALQFPNPQSYWRAALAFEPGNNNVVAYVNGKVDYLCDRYAHQPDLAERIAIARQIDGLVSADAPYVLGWVNPAERVLHWNRFGMPPWATGRTGPLAKADTLWVLWWLDPDRVAQIEAAKTDGSTAMPTVPRDLKFWPQWDAAHPTP